MRQNENKASGILVRENKTQVIQSQPAALSDVPEVKA